MRSDCVRLSLRISCPPGVTQGAPWDHAQNQDVYEHTLFDGPLTVLTIL